MSSVSLSRTNRLNTNKMHHNSRLFILLFQRKTLLSVVVLATLALSYCSDDRGGLAIIRIDRMPTGVTVLEVMATLDGYDAFDIIKIPALHASPFEFGIRLDRKYHSTVTLGVAAVTDTGCVLGTAETNIASDNISQITQVRVEFDDWAPGTSSCRSSGPIVRDIIPSSLSTLGIDLSGKKSSIKIRGWRFNKKQKVTLGSSESLPIGYITPTTLSLAELSLPLQNFGDIMGTVSEPGTTNAADGFHLSVFLPELSLRPQPQVSAGMVHTCVLRDLGDVYCFGYNNSGELGNGSKLSSRSPIKVQTNAMEIAAGSRHTCVILSDGSTRCWGVNSSYQLGTIFPEYATAQVLVPNIGGQYLPAVSISLGNAYSCALLKSGEARCWGNNLDGQLGIEDSTGKSTPIPQAVVTDDGRPLANISKMSAGIFHSCALLSDGRVLCWGQNSSSQIGKPRSNNFQYPQVVMEGRSPLLAVELALGEFHTCARQNSGRVLCWGGNSYGQLGAGATQESANPVEALATGARMLRSGYRHTCIITIDDRVLCWGSNAQGQLGTGTGMAETRPKEVLGLPPRPVTLGAAAGHTCILFGDGSSRCFGDNTYGQFGNGTGISSTTPVPGFTFPI